MLANGRRARVLINLADGGNYINPRFVEKYNIRYREKEHPYELITIDSSPSTYGGGLILIET